MRDIARPIREAFERIVGHVDGRIDLDRIPSRLYAGGYTDQRTRSEYIKFRRAWLAAIDYETEKGRTR